jgi:hypothetical protein
MPTRLRARDKAGNLVTILDRTLPKRKNANVNIRDAHGFKQTVKLGDLTPVPADEGGAFLRFGDDAA